MLKIPTDKFSPSISTKCPQYLNMNTLFKQKNKNCFKKQKSFLKKLKKLQPSLTAYPGTKDCSGI